MNVQEIALQLMPYAVDYPGSLKERFQMCLEAAALKPLPGVTFRKVEDCNADGSPKTMTVAFRKAGIQSGVGFDLKDNIDREAETFNNIEEYWKSRGIDSSLEARQAIAKDKNCPIEKVCGYYKGAGILITDSFPPK